MIISERYQKALVTVAMGLRTEEDIKLNGLYRFDKSEKNELLNYTQQLFNQKSNLLVLKIKPTGFRSEHINITTQQEYESFCNNLDEIYGENNEVWVVSSSVKECWRCRFYLSADLHTPDRIEMAYSTDDHIIDHIQLNNNSVPYICFEKKVFDNNYEIVKTTGDNVDIAYVQNILKEVLSKYKYEFKSIKEDLELLKINGISIDCRVNNGYDFHDFDVSYEEVKKIIDFYVPEYLKKMANRKKDR